MDVVVVLVISVEVVRVLGFVGEFVEKLFFVVGKMIVKVVESVGFLYVEVVDGDGVVFVVVLCECFLGELKFVFFYFVGEFCLLWLE